MVTYMSQRNAYIANTYITKLNGFITPHDLNEKWGLNSHHFSPMFYIKKKTAGLDGARLSIFLYIMSRAVNLMHLHVFFATS